MPDFNFSRGWWYPVVLGIILIVIILFMPKRLSWKEIYITFGIIGYIVWMVDITLAVPFDLFDIGHPEKEGISEIFLFGIIPSCLSIIYLNFYKRERRWLFVCSFIILSLSLAWLNVEVGPMHLKKWNVWWSTPVHFIAYAYFLPWHLRFIRRKND